MAAEHTSRAPARLNLTVDESLLYPTVDESLLYPTVDEILLNPSVGTSLLILTAPVAQELSTTVLNQDMAHGKNKPLPRLRKT